MAKLPEMKLAHVGIWVQDFARMKDFYVRMFGFGIADEGLLNGNRYAFMSRDPQDHHQVIVAEGRKPETEQTTVNQISFRCENLGQLRQVYEAVSTDKDVQKVFVTDHGNAWSVYFFDPEGNRLEAFMDTPWYINQPHRFDLDFSLSDEEILAQSEAHAKADPSFRPIEDWREEFRNRIPAPAEGA
ncbi:MAG: VOC family protein [Pseudomonadota bacterium]|nr:VOC family protein [Pseudomonadota bacterium]